MVIIIDNSFLIFKKRDIFLSEYPYDIGNKIDAVSFHYCKYKITMPGYTCREQLTSTIDLNQESEEIWKKMNRKLRQKIKKATKENITWKINENFNEFYAISKDFMKQKNYATRLGFLSLELPNVKIMEKYGTLFTAELNGDVLGGHLYLEDNENILAWISASRRLAVDKETSTLINCANCLLHWQAIMYAQEKSIRTFNWGGLWSEKEALDPKKNSVNAFKLSFGGGTEKAYSYSKINNKLYEKLSYLYNKTLAREAGSQEAVSEEIES
jgi:hypothetical protein